MSIPTVAWDETNPPDTALRSEGDDRIRELKTQFREVFAVDHKMPYSYPGNLSGTDWGYHNKLTLNKAIVSPIEAGVGSLYCYYNETTSKYYLAYYNGTSVSYLMYENEIIGGIINEIRPWYGTLANIPYGWLLCDGMSGTPNLISKFIRGIATSTTNPESTGGSNTVTLAETNLPSHSHTLNSGGLHQHFLRETPYDQTPMGSNNSLAVRPNASTVIWFSKIGNNDGVHYHTYRYTGNGTAFDIRPSYYEVAYIIKV